MPSRADNTAPCPYCGEPVYDDAEQCPHCGQYLSEEDTPRRKPIWFVVTAIVCLIISLIWAFG